MPSAILVVDDDKEILTLLRSILRNHSVDTATSVCEAVSCFQERRHELVITDLELPGHPGWKLADAVKSIDERTVVILLSGALFDRELLQRHRIDHYFPKPCDLLALRRTVDACTARHKPLSRTTS